MILVKHEDQVEEEQNTCKNEGDLEICGFLSFVNLGAEDGAVGGRYTKIF